MYKLFLCLRYLRSRIIAYFAVLAVALCVAMMLIVISVMNGFLDKIEQAAKGLFGDIVVASGSLSGLGRYDEFMAEVRREVPEVEASSPFILTFSLLSIPDQPYRQMLQVAGIRLPQRAEVTDFKKGLFAQAGLDAPTFDPPISLLREKLDAHTEQLKAIYKNQLDQRDPADLPGDVKDTLRRLEVAWSMQADAAAVLRGAESYQDRLKDLGEKLAAAEASAHGLYSDEAVELAEELDELVEAAQYQAPNNRAILGLGIPGLILRTEQGQTVRYISPGDQIVLSILPLSSKLSAADMTPNVMRLTVVDDCRTDVSSIDSAIVYVPFETLQRMNNMGAEYDGDDPDLQVIPPRCSQIHLKVSPEYCGEEALREVCKKVQAVWYDFRRRYGDAVEPGVNVSIETWRQRQAKVIGPIQQQRTLVVIMFGIISLVSVVLIFVIFYTIVVQKTRDIGVLKAVGASSGGVAQVFLAWGGAVGLVGSMLGTIGGYYFVRYINPIQDALDTWFGFRVWSREWFLFEKIPNTVDPATAAIIAAGAILAGLIGATVPAIRAARMQPVEALRYE